MKATVDNIGAVLARKRLPNEPVGVLIGHKGNRAIVSNYPFGILYLGLNGLDRYIPNLSDGDSGYFTFKAMLLKK